ncbi:hypothetical protein LCGC14_1305750 [marine sediment metagenome]|uniref:Uncharacterized protein n=1 Tax=marine sediment metagenome TaxID=412755 RepID=A0A0F9NRG1_9ZZZZ
MGSVGFPMGLAEMQDIAMQGEDWPPKQETEQCNGYE